MPKGNFTTKFESIASCIEISDSNISLASLAGLKALIPEGVLENPALLPFAGNLYVSDLGNRNGDCIRKEETLKYYKQLLATKIDLEHVKTKVVGNIVNVGFSTFNETDFLEGGDCELLTLEQVEALDDLFNVAIAGVIYKDAYPNVAEKIIDSTDTTSKKFLSVSYSWEFSFSDWCVLLGSSVYNGKIISDEEEMKPYFKYLKCNKGKGKLKDGTPVNRLIIGELIPLGAAVTLNPAGQVKGLVVPDGELENLREEAEASSEAVATKETSEVIEAIIISEIAEASLEATDSLVISSIIENNTINSSLLNNDFVNPNTDIELSSLLKTNKIMSIKFLESFAALEVLPQEELANVSVANLRSVLSDKIREVSEQWDTKNKAKDQEASIALARAEDAEKQTKEAAKQLETLAKQLEEVKKAQELSETNASFQLRMSGLDSKYNLDDKDRSVIAKNIKGLDDVGFSDYLKDCEVIFASKDKKKMTDDEKAAKDKKDKEDGDEEAKAKKAKADAEDGDMEAKKKKAAKMKEEAKAAKELAEAAFSNASIEFDNLQNNISLEVSLADKFKNAFSKENVLVKHKGR